MFGHTFYEEPNINYFISNGRNNPFEAYHIFDKQLASRFLDKGRCELFSVIKAIY